MKLKIPKKRKKRLAVICAKGLESFLTWTEAFQDEYDVRLVFVSADDKGKQEIFEAVEWADLIWLEWGNETSAIATRCRHIVYKEKVIVRVHSYEVLSGHINLLNWNVVSDVIFVAEHVKDTAIGILPNVFKEG